MMGNLQNPPCGEPNFNKKYFLSSINIKLLLKQVNKLLLLVWEKYKERTIILTFSLKHVIQY